MHKLSRSHHAPSTAFTISVSKKSKPWTRLQSPSLFESIILFWLQMFVKLFCFLNISKLKKKMKLRTNLKTSWDWTTQTDCFHSLAQRVFLKSWKEDKTPPTATLAASNLGKSCKNKFLHVLVPKQTWTPTSSLYCLYHGCMVYMQSNLCWKGKRKKVRRKRTSV